MDSINYIKKRGHIYFDTRKLATGLRISASNFFLWCKKHEDKLRGLGNVITHIASDGQKTQYLVLNEHQVMFLISQYSNTPETIDYKYKLIQTCYNHWLDFNTEYSPTIEPIRTSEDVELLKREIDIYTLLGYTLDEARLEACNAVYLSLGHNYKGRLKRDNQEAIKLAKREYFSEGEIANKLGILEKEIREELIEWGWLEQRDGGRNRWYPTEEGMQYCQIRYKNDRGDEIILKEIDDNWLVRYYWIGKVVIKRYKEKGKK